MTKRSSPPLVALMFVLSGSIFGVIAIFDFVDSGHLDVSAAIAASMAYFTAWLAYRQAKREG